MDQGYLRIGRVGTGRSPGTGRDRTCNWCRESAGDRRVACFARRCRSDGPAVHHVVFCTVPPSGRGPCNRTTDHVRLLEGLSAGLLARPVFRLARLQPDHAGAAVCPDFPCTGPSGAVAGTMALPPAAGCRAHGTGFRHRRCFPDQLAPERLLGPASAGRVAGHARGGVAGGAPTESVVVVLDADRGAPGGWRHGLPGPPAQGGRGWLARWLGQACLRARIPPYQGGVHRPGGTRGPGAERRFGGSRGLFGHRGHGLLPY